MDFLLDALTNWLKEMLVGGIMGNLTGMFDSVNQQVADIATQVGQTPQGWNGSIFSMIQNLSNSIMVPIAGVILAIVMTLELIQMITDRNNLHDVDTWMIFKWVFKSAAAILLVTNTWNLVMGVFDMAQSVVAQASGIIGSDASIDISSVMTDMESRLMDMDLGPLFGLWFQALFIGITTVSYTHLPGQPRYARRRLVTAAFLLHRPRRHDMNQMEIFKNPEFGAIRTFEPVSYTHLDVYKRQGFRCIMISPGKVFLGRIEGEGEIRFQQLRPRFLQCLFQYNRGQ